MIKLERYEIEQDIIEHMQDATVQAERAGKIIHTLKDFLRKDTSQRMNVNLNELINNAMRLLSHDFHNQEINVVLNLSEDLPSSIMEKIQIEQVIINLMRNGLEAMNELDDESSKRLTVSTSTSGDAVLMTVADLGCGISSSNKDKIFEAFFSTKEQGMGMGLSICRSIIENHHGKLHVRENKPYGTIFELELPFEREFA